MMSAGLSAWRSEMGTREHEAERTPTGTVQSDVDVALRHDDGGRRRGRSSTRRRLLIAAALRPGLDEIEWLVGARPAGRRLSDADGRRRGALPVLDSSASPATRSSYYDWRNSCLDRVIATRVGIPITLSVLMIEVARRVGVPLVGVGMPAHFLVGVADDPDAFYDPFHGPQRLDRTAAADLFHQVTGAGATWSDEFLAPTSAPRHRDPHAQQPACACSPAVPTSCASRVVMSAALPQVPELAATEHDEIIAAHRHVQLNLSRVGQALRDRFGAVHGCRRSHVANYVPSMTVIDSPDHPS